MKYSNPVLVLGLYFPGIDILNYFSLYGIEVIGLDYQLGNYGFFVKNGRKLICPNPEEKEEEFVDFILGLQFKSSEKPVLLNTSDSFIKSIHKHQELIAQKYLMFESRNGIIESLLTKESQFKFAVKHGINTPRTLFSEEITCEDVKRLKYPVIIKPLYAPAWRSGELGSLFKGRKVVLINQLSEYEFWRDKLEKHDCTYIVQEIIEGPDPNLVYLVFLFDKQAKCRGYFGGIKVRNTPPHFGSASFVTTLTDYTSLPINQIIRFFESESYEGPVGIEFKKDQKDGVYKIIEINPRFGLWDSIGSKVGVDAFGIVYNSLVNKSSEGFAQPILKKHHWLSFSRDLNAFVVYRKEGVLSLFSWLRSFMQSDMTVCDLIIREPRLMYEIYLKKVIRKLRKF